MPIFIINEPIVRSFRYKEDVILDMSSGRYLTENTGGIHTLEIPRYSDKKGSYIYINMPITETYLLFIISSLNICSCRGQDRDV